MKIIIITALMLVFPIASEVDAETKDTLTCQAEETAPASASDFGACLAAYLQCLDDQNCGFDKACQAECRQVPECTG